VFHIDGLQPVISPAPDAEQFWGALREHRLELPYCDDCDSAFFYPRAICPRCGSRAIRWVRSNGKGTLYSFCVQYRSAIPGLTSSPFVTALVDLDEGPRMMGFLVGVPDDPDLIRCGIEVLAEFLEVADGRTVVSFRPVERES
jgi:uncharacterized OB-fold protein